MPRMWNSYSNSYSAKLSKVRKVKYQAEPHLDAADVELVQRALHLLHRRHEGGGLADDLDQLAGRREGGEGDRAGEDEERAATKKRQMRQGWQQGC